MRKFTVAAKLLTLFILAASLTSCLKDACKSTYTIYEPIYKSLTEVRQSMKSMAPQSMQQTGKIYMYGQYIFLNEIDKGIHVIDNANPSSPRTISFIPIPGNVDLAVKDNNLYADSYTDMVVFDISTPTQVTAKKFISKVFPYSRGIQWASTNDPNETKVIVGYNKRDTTVDCETYETWRSCNNCEFALANGNKFMASAPTGTGGSMARFSVVNDYLYTVTTNELYTFNIADAANPNQVSKKQLNNWNIETIYPFQDKLFIGSNNGMMIYDISTPATPSYVSQLSHFRSCDPVITDGQHAYVTLRSGTTCQGTINQLDVVDVTNLAQPKLLKTYAMTSPHGLSKDGDLLFVCDGTDGLKIFDAQDATNIKPIKKIGGLETYDVILQNNIALVVAKDGLYQYDYSNRNNIHLLSKISIAK